MQTFTAGQVNTVKVDVVAKASGDPITSGTVNFYLKAITGTNAGKYFRASDSSWQASESSAGAATYDGGSAWSLSIAAAAWISGVDYRLYAKESGDLNIIYDEHLSDGMDFVRAILEGDATIDTTTTPWQLVVKRKGTSTELIRKDLKNVAGADIASTTTVIGQQVEP
jgi:hypothetical protein